jgi:hypothetical protein
VRDFSADLADDRCWTRKTEFLFRVRGVPLDDCLLQNRAELVAFCEWIEANEIRSYLEIGVWTGRLVSLLQRLFRFDLVAACDLGVAQDRFGLPLHLPDDVNYLKASSRSPEFRAWREELGHVDLVLIDADHTYAAVKADFELNRQFPHRFLALHDVANRHPSAVGVKRLWEELEGEKTEIVRPLPHSRHRMGIGIWSALP